MLSGRKSTAVLIQRLCPSHRTPYLPEVRNPNLLPFNIAHTSDSRIFDVIGFTRIHVMLGLRAPLPPREEKSIGGINLTPESLQSDRRA